MLTECLWWPIVFVFCAVLEALNQLPHEQHGNDIMRVRLHLLASQGRLYRQTIITSSFTTPLLNAAFNKLCCSHAGKLRLLAQPVGVLAQVVPQVCMNRLSLICSAVQAPLRAVCYVSLCFVSGGP
jgi:hypothetical protein